MTPSRLFIVLLRVLGVYLVAVHGSMAIMFAAGLLNIGGMSSEEYANVAPFMRRDLLGRALVAAFGLYALFGGRALLALLPREWRDDRSIVVALDARAVALVAIRVVGLLLIAGYAQTFVMALRGGIAAADVWSLAIGALPIAIGVYLLFGGGWIVRQAAAGASGDPGAAGAA